MMSAVVEIHLELCLGTPNKIRLPLGLAGDFLGLVLRFLVLAQF